ncbi:hypothetical protein [Novosphingobium sp.]|uniref:hypothetical protein n=1 Tax=Novosphingobium sp. TaxID=1874826 RepID=UPI0038B8C67B
MLKDIERFWSKVDKRGEDECWPWAGAKSGAGYGSIRQSARRGKYKHLMATHVALHLDGRKRPSKAHVAMHSCDNPPCVNPKHLSWGTNLDNSLDMVSKDRDRGGPKRIVRRQKEAKAMAAAAEEMDAAATNLGPTMKRRLKRPSA